jgi:hypothetical protein
MVHILSFGGMAGLTAMDHLSIMWGHNLEHGGVGGGGAARTMEM